MFAALTLTLGLTFAAPGSLRTAVVITGTDDLAAGSLQKDLEKELAKVPGIELVPVHEVAAALSGAAGAAEVPPPTLEPKLREEWEALFTQVAQFYLDDRLQDSLQRINDIRLSHEKTPFVPAAEMQRRLLWHATVLLAQGEAEAADSRVRAALTLDPDATIDGRVFPPGVRAIATTVRAEGFRKVHLDVRGVPAGGKVLVDGRPLADDGRVAAGSHRVAAWAPGFRWVEQPVSAADDTELVFTLPLAPPLEADKLLRTTATLGPDDLADKDALEAFAKSVGARALFIGARITPESDPCETGAPATASKGRIVGVVWRASRPRTVLPAPRYEDDAKGIRSEGLWLADTLGEISRGFFASNGASLRAGVGSMQRYTRVHDEDNSFRRNYNGSAFTVAAGVAPGVWTAGLEGEFVLFSGGARVDGGGTTAEGGPDGKAGAGTSFAMRAAAGRRFLVLGNTFTQGTWVAIRAYGSAEHYYAQDFVDADGNKLGFFPEERVLSAGPEVRVGTRVPGVTDLLLEGSAVGLYRSWSQFPKGTFGHSPDVGGTRAFGIGAVEASASFRPFRKLARLRATRVHATVRNEYRTVRFQGVARAPVEPRITGARLEQNLFSAVLSLEWRP